MTFRGDGVENNKKEGSRWLLRLAHGTRNEQGTDHNYVLKHNL